MSNLSKGKHFRIEDRLIIEYRLDENYALKEIAERVGKDPTTVSKEIKRNRFLKTNKRKEHDIKPCMHRRNCTKMNLCNNNCSKQCKKCTFINCYRVCKNYSIKQCSKLNRYPYVYNGCNKVSTCTAEKSYYKAKVAESKYKEILVSSREGLNITSRDLKKIDLLFHHLSLNGNQYLIFLHIINMNLIILKEHYTIILTKMFLKLEILIYQGK